MPRWTKADLDAAQARIDGRQPGCGKPSPDVVIETDIEQLYEAYLKTGSVHRAAKEFGLAGETVRKRLMQSGKKLNRSKWTDSELQLLKETYANPDGFDLSALAKDLGKTHAAVACKADDLGLCGDRGKQIRTPLSKARMSASRKELAAKRAAKEGRPWPPVPPPKRIGHPRGMLGKHHTQDAKDAIAKAHIGKKVPRERIARQMATRLSRHGTLAPKNARGSWKAAWHEIDGVRFFARSKWESNYAYYLQWRKEHGEILKWEHEPETFWFTGVKRGVVSYLPDFKVTFPCGRVEFHEVKGWMDARSATKIKRMAKYHPTVVLQVIDSKRYKVLNRQLSRIVPGWA